MIISGWETMDAHHIEAVPLTRLAPFVDAARVRRTTEELATLAAALRGRRLFVITGDDRRKGGVYEILRTLLPYLVGAGIEVVWTNIDTHPDARPALEFFHVLAHGHPPTARWSEELTEHNQRLRRFGAAGAEALIPALRAGDVVFAHDTQTALTATAISTAGWPVIWHAQIGSGLRNQLTAAYWQVFGDALAAVQRTVFFIDDYVPTQLRHNAACALPSIDPSISKNALMPRGDARHLLPGLAAAAAATGRAETIADDAVIAVQVSRWDQLKDMCGVTKGFAQLAAQRPNFHGMLVGTVAQSANERAQLDACLQTVDAAGPVADRLHVWTVPDSGSRAHDDSIAAVQCAADVIVQKSLQEGFGLTVTEAMLKAKPVVASRVGGIPTQICDGQTGVLLTDPADLDHFIAVLAALCDDPARRHRLGQAAQRAARRRFTTDIQLCALAPLLRPER